MLKETTASFDGARTHDWQASTDNEDHIEIMCQGTRELGLLDYGLTTGVEAMLTSGIWQYNLLIVITFTRLINLRLSRVAFENRVDLNLNFLLKQVYKQLHGVIEEYTHTFCFKSSLVCDISLTYTRRSVNITKVHRKTKWQSITIHLNFGP